ncbi:hypothetical protein SANTM175S_08484 [Streptomyces antimycoticus]
MGDLPRSSRRRCASSRPRRCTTSRTICAPPDLAQLRRILDDPEASANDRFVALDLLKNANIAAAGVLPMCQDTGTAIVMGKRGQNVLTEGGDEEALSRGAWLDMVAEVVSRGVVMRRARIVSEPVSEYARYLYDGTFTNVAAGERDPLASPPERVGHCPAGQ